MLLTTRYKISLARAALAFVRIGRRLRGLGDEAYVARGGLNWRLDLSEGIDFSIYLRGAFEPEIVRACHRLVRRGDVVFEVGANVGAHTLPIAALVGDAGCVVAIEPTLWAIRKLRANALLNPTLEPRIRVRQAFLTAPGSAAPTSSELYSSWPLVARDDETLHPEHRARAHSTEGAESMTFDAAFAREGLARLDLVKIDVDGNEVDVVAGGLETFKRFRPRIILELAPYLFEPDRFGALLGMLRGLGYELRELGGKRAIGGTPMEISAGIPAGASRNVLLVPKGS